jgi:hypothetical protein
VAVSFLLSEIGQPAILPERFHESVCRLFALKNDAAVVIIRRCILHGESQDFGSIDMFAVFCRPDMILLDIATRAPEHRCLSGQVFFE